MKRLFMVAAVFCLYFIPVHSMAQALWLRYPALSPDGKTIAFEYKGDIYKVAVEGGDAQQLTSHTAYDYKPVWSPDGKTIAFASDRFGNFDIYTISAEGGEAKRLTFVSVNETPSCFSPDGKSIYFNAAIQDVPGNYQFPIGLLTELYTVPVTGGAIHQVLSTTAEDAQVNKANNKIFYQDRKGYEDPFRKHHTSSIARDVWMYDMNTKKHTKLSQFAGEDRNPVLGSDEKYVYYLTEQFGSNMNVARFPVDHPDKVEQLTHFKTNPVRFLSIANNNTMAFSYNGELYRLQPGQEPVKLKVNILSDNSYNLTRHEVFNSGATEMAVSPNGKEVALIIRGEVYVTLVDGKLTKRITNTPEQERSVSFSPDGRTLLYASERNNSWNVYQTKIVRSEEKYFALATLLKESPVIATDAEEFQPAYSPDGKEVAFLQERTTLRVINLSTKKVRTVLDGKYNYSYRDGDQWYRWSPDGKWFLVNYTTDHLFRPEVGLVDAEGKQDIVNLTKSGYNDNSPKWMVGGKVVLWFSDKQGMRSHGSWGSMYDAYGLYLDKNAFDEFKLSKSEYDLLKGKKKTSTVKPDKKQAKKKKKETEAKPKKLVKIDWNGLDDRVVRFTINSSKLADAVLSKKGDKLYYLTSFEKGYNLWEHDFRKKITKQLVTLKAGNGELTMAKDGKSLFVFARGKIIKIDLTSKKQTRVSYSADFDYDYLAEKSYIFEHAWRQMEKKFYNPNMHGLDWEKYKKNYEQFLPYINNNYDFAEMLSEMLGELNASHTGCRYYHRGDKSSDATAVLGLLYDWDYKGTGMKIAEVLDKSPVLDENTKIKPGVIIEKINGQTFPNNTGFYVLMNHQAGKRVLLSLFDGNKRWDEIVKPISIRAQNQLLYERWVKIMRAETDRLSNGRLGYVHVRGMNDASFREVYSDVFGRYAKKDGIIIDTRFNGGGWLHDDLAVLFSGKQYVTYAPRGVKMGYDPMSRWSKPTILLVSESNYSDASAFPYVYTTLKIGKTVGMPVPGTMTAVWWERQIDPTLVFGMPEVGSLDINGKYLENQQLEPDFKVRQDYDVIIHRHDQQLEKAAAELLKTIQ
jgi:tricorn protease